FRHTRADGLFSSQFQRDDSGEQQCRRYNYHQYLLAAHFYRNPFNAGKWILMCFIPYHLSGSCEPLCSPVIKKAAGTASSGLSLIVGSPHWTIFAILLDHNHRSAQFLPAVARSALNPPVTPSRKH